MYAYQWTGAELSCTKGGSSEQGKSILAKRVSSDTPLSENYIVGRGQIFV